MPVIGKSTGRGAVAERSESASCTGLLTPDPNACDSEAIDEPLTIPGCVTLIAAIGASCESASPRARTQTASAIVGGRSVQGGGANGGASEEAQEVVRMAARRSRSSVRLVKKAFRVSRNQFS